MDIARRNISLDPTIVVLSGRDADIVEKLIMLKKLVSTRTQDYAATEEMNFLQIQNVREEALPYKNLRILFHQHVRALRRKS